jgi:hypothetical protein
MKRKYFLMILILIGLFGLAGYACAASASDIDETFTTMKKWLYGGQDLEKKVTPPREEVAPPPEDTTPKTPVRPSETPPPKRPSQIGAVDDDHYIQPDDYFIGDKPLGTYTWVRVNIGKMVTPPNPQTKGEAEFFRVRDGNKIWTKYFWTTRIATQDDLKLGVHVIMLDRRDGDIFRPPKSKEERNSDWFMAKITDLSDLYRGYVTASGGYKISPNALRVIVNR